MRNFWNDIALSVGNEPIEAVIIGPFGWKLNSDDDPKIPQEYLGVVLSPDVAKPYLDYEYSAGYGAPECHAINVYTSTKVYFVAQYDGSTSIKYILRNPTEGEIPSMPGG